MHQVTGSSAQSGDETIVEASVTIHQDTSTSGAVVIDRVVVVVSLVVVDIIVVVVSHDATADLTDNDADNTIDTEEKVTATRDKT